MNKGPFLPRRNNSAVREYEHAVERGQKLLVTGFHVTFLDGKWFVKRGKAPSRFFKTQAEAVEAAKKIAKKEGVELFIYGRDGRIRERNSYSPDPFSPRG